MNGNLTETAVYSKRWIILSGFCCIGFLSNFACKSFSISNQIFANYFEVNLTAFDWSTLAMYLGATLAAPIFAWLFFKQTAGFRFLSITGAISLLVSYLVIVLSIHFPRLFPLMIASNMLQGVAYTVAVTVGPSFAVVWFPNHEVGLAIACDLFCNNFGILLSSLLPPLFLHQSPSASAHNSTYIDTVKHQEEWKTKTHNTLLIFYTPCVIGLLVLLLLFIAFMSDQPLKPPTHAMLAKRNVQRAAKPDSTFYQFLTAVKSLHKDVNYLLFALAFNIIFSLNIVIFLHITVIVKHFYINTVALSNDIISGVIVSTLAFSYMIFGFVSAKISNKWKNYSGQALIGEVLTLVALLGTVLGFYYQNFKAFCVCLLFYTIGTRIFVIPVLEVITRHTYPIDETFVSVWVGASSCFIHIIIGEIARIISLYMASIGLLICMCTFAFISFVLILMSNPTDKRRKADTENEQIDETIPLLAEK